MRFESSVISYGSQTQIPGYAAILLFESSVISYGSQTVVFPVPAGPGLRVVLSHMVVKLQELITLLDMRLRVVLSHMVVKQPMKCGTR